MGKRDIWQTPVERMERKKFLAQQREMARVYGPWRSEGPTERKKRDKKILKNP